MKHRHSDRTNAAHATQPEPSTDANHYLQSPVWTAVKRQFGWRSISVEFDTPELGKVKLYIYVRRVPGLGRLGYAPMWPNIFSEQSMQVIADKLRAVGRQHGLFLIQIEPCMKAADVDVQALEAAGYHLTHTHVQYLATLVVDLHPSAAEIFGAFNATTRNEIRRAEREGLVCKRLPLSEDELVNFHNMLSATHDRQKFYLRKADFLYSYWRRFGQAGEGRLYATEYQGKVLSMAFVIVRGNRAYYKDAGMLLNSETQKLGAPVLQLWRIMQDLKDSGVTAYDLCGALATGIEQPSDPLWRVYSFKRRFTKNLEVYPGIIDLPLKATKYKLWRICRRPLLRIYTAVTRHLWY